MCFLFSKRCIMDIFRKLVWFIQLLNLKYKHEIISIRRHCNFFKKKKKKTILYNVTRTRKIQLNSTCSKGIYKQQKTKHEMWCRCHQGTCKTRKMSNIVIWNRSWIKRQEKGKQPLLISLFGEGSVSQNNIQFFTFFKYPADFELLTLALEFLSAPISQGFSTWLPFFNPSSICSF